MNSTQGLGALLAPYTTNVVSKFVGVSTATVTNWRAGRTKPDRQHWNSICLLTGLHMHDLISVISHDKQDGKADEIGKRVMRLPQKDRLALIAMLSRLEIRSQKGHVDDSCA